MKIIRLKFSLMLMTVVMGLL